MATLMSNWNKVENNVKNSAESSHHTGRSDKNRTPPVHDTHKRQGAAAPKSGPAHMKRRTPSPAEQLPSAPRPEERPTYPPLRYTARGRRRGRYRFAAPFGFCVLLLAAVGLVSLVVLGIRGIQHSQDDTPLRTELSDFLSPVMQYNPQAFSDVNDTKQDALLLSAIWRVTDAERIREKRENTTVCSYQMDEMGRMLIPVSEIEESYATLFGPDAVPYHHNIGDEGSFTFEYDKENGYYHVPLVSSPSTYVPVIDTLKKKGDTVVVRVGYVLSSKVGIDEKGNTVEPTADMADYFQDYTVKRVGETGWMLTSIADEKTSSTSAPATGSQKEETPNSAKAESGAAMSTNAVASSSAVSENTTAAAAAGLS